MKKFWISILCIFALTLCVGFVGCANDKEDKGNSQSQTHEDDDLYTDNY